MGKQETPNWNNAPQWAQYWAVDPDGRSFWYEVEPFVTFDLLGDGTNINGWFFDDDKESSTKIKPYGKVENAPDWTKTLQQRPNALPENGPKEPEYFKVTKGRNYLTGWPDTGF